MRYKALTATKSKSPNYTKHSNGVVILVNLIPIVLQPIDH